MLLFLRSEIGDSTLGKGTKSGKMLMQEKEWAVAN